MGCHREVSVQQNIVYRQVGDTQLELDLYFPLSKPKNPRPAEIVLHGGAWRHGDKGDMMEVAIKLAKRGYVVASVGYRFRPSWKMYKQRFAGYANTPKNIKLNQKKSAD